MGGMPTSKGTGGSNKGAARKGLDGTQLSKDETYRKEAKAAFDSHVQANSTGKDVLTRCKRLNEFLETVRAGLTSHDSEGTYNTRGCSKSPRPKRGSS